MATLLTAPDLPSSDEEDADFAPDTVAADADQSGKAKRKFAQTAHVAALLSEMAQARSASAQVAKRAKSDEVWAQLKGSQGPAAASRTVSSASLANLCKPTVKAESTASRQVTRLAAVAQSATCQVTHSHRLSGCRLVCNEL